MQWRQTKIDSTYFEGFCNSDAPVQPTWANIHTHTFCKTLDIKDHKNKVQHVPWMFSDTLSQAMESTYYFIWILQLFSPTAIVLHLGLFFNLPQSQIYPWLPLHSDQMCPLLNRNANTLHCVTHYGSRIMVLLLLYSKIWNDSRKQHHVKAANRRTGQLLFHYLPFQYNLCISRKPKQHANPKQKVLVTQDLLFQL